MAPSPVVGGGDAVAMAPPPVVCVNPHGEDSTGNSGSSGSGGSTGSGGGGGGGDNLYGEGSNGNAGSSGKKGTKRKEPA